MKRRLATLIPLLLLALLVSLMLARLENPRMSGSIDSPLIGKAIPNIEGVNIQPPYVINFFASWCAPCEIEHPFLMEAKKAGLKIIGVAYKDTKEKIDAFIERKGNPYEQIIMDDKGDIGLQLGITGVPETFSVDALGIVKSRQQGPYTEAITP